MLTSSSSVFDTWLPLEGSDVPAPDATRIGSPLPTRVLKLLILLRPKSESGERFPSITTRGGSADNAAELFSASQEDADQVVTFLTANSLSVSSVDLASRCIRVSGTVANCVNAFQVDLGLYENGSDLYISMVGPVFVPSNVVSIIIDVIGLDARPDIEVSPDLAPVGTPIDQIRALYKIPNSPDGGLGQKIGILGYVKFSKSLKSDVRKSWGLPNDDPLDRIEVVIVGDGPDDKLIDKDQIDAFRGELVGDIAIAGLIAQGAKIVLFLAPWTHAGIVDSQLTALASDVSILSNSYVAAFETRWQMISWFLDYSYQGRPDMSVLCLSGDHGSIFGASGPQVVVPTALRYITSCGGTKLSDDGSKEVVWQNDHFGAGKGSSGGGASSVLGVPYYQADLIDEVADKVFTNGKGRRFPDVAAFADGISYVYNNEQTALAGTSASAPLWAGIIALLNQHAKRPLGFLNELIYYRWGPNGDLTDVVDGNNDTRPEPSTPPIFEAKPGWDPCTGWGTPNYEKLLASLQEPAVSSIEPREVPTGGLDPNVDAPLMITGENLAGAWRITFGSTNVFDFFVLSDTQISVWPPPMDKGTYHALVHTAMGPSSKSQADTVNYFVPLPVLTSLDPSSASIRGGDTMTITGRFLLTTTEVVFVGQDQVVFVTPDVATDDGLSVTIPAFKTQETIQIFVHTEGGDSASMSFEYEDVPREEYAIIPKPGIDATSLSTLRDTLASKCDLTDQTFFLLTFWTAPLSTAGAHDIQVLDNVFIVFPTALSKLVLDAAGNLVDLVNFIKDKVDTTFKSSEPLVSGDLDVPAEASAQDDNLNPMTCKVKKALEEEVFV